MAQPNHSTKPTKPAKPIKAYASLKVEGPRGGATPPGILKRKRGSDRWNDYQREIFSEKEVAPVSVLLTATSIFLLYYFISQMEKLVQGWC